MKPPKNGNWYGLKLEEKRIIKAIDQGETPIEAIDYPDHGPLSVPIETLWQWKVASEVWRKEGQRE